MDFIITIGNKPYQAAISKNQFRGLKTLSAFIDRHNFKKQKNNHAIFNDVNPKLHYKLIERLFDKSTVKLGFFYDKETASIKDELIKQNSNRDFQLIGVIPPLNNSASHIHEFAKENNLDAFLILPSNNLYSPSKLDSIFFNLFQLRIPSIVYTPKLVQNGVGGVASVSFDIEIIVDTINKEVSNFYNIGRFNKTIIVPDKAKIHVNKRLARSLDLNTTFIGNEEMVIYEKD